jgi:hypothetical protein
MKQADAEEIFLTLLQRIQRQYDQQHSPYLERPPDEAASALGKLLGQTFHSMIEEKQGILKKALQEKALIALSSKHVNPAVSQAFFHCLLTIEPPSRLVGMEWLTSWIVHCEQEILEPTNHAGEPISFDALTITIRAYAKFKQKTASTTAAAGDTETSSHSIATAFRRLQTSAARNCMLREFTHVAFEDVEYVRALLSPLMAASVLTISTPLQEGMFFLEGLWRESWAEVERCRDVYVLFDCFSDLLNWMTTCLNLFLWGIPCRPNFEQLTAKELGHRWLVQLLELGAFLAQSLADTEDPAHAQSLTQWVTLILGGTLPNLMATIPSYRISMEPALQQVEGILAKLLEKGTQLQLDTVAAFRLAALCMSDPIKEDVRSILRILGGVTLPTSSGRSVHASPCIQGIFRAVASIFLRDQVCNSDGRELLHSLSVISSQKSLGSASTAATAITKKASTVCNVIQFLDESVVNVDDFVAFLSREDSFEHVQHLTALQQTGALLLGIGLLEEPKNRPAAYRYLKNLLSKFSHLSISLLPVLVDSINHACVRGDGETLLRQLEFLCDAVAYDKQCAKEIYNLLGVEMMKPGTPSVIRAAVIRLFPKLCATNKRLYKRVIDALGNSLATDKSIEVRLAVAATVTQLAREDRIRDVTDVIGWIQGFIVDVGWVKSKHTNDDETAPGNAVLVHYAILSLHHLVVAQELDFSLVLVVINKRLCNVHDMREVLKLPPIVLEVLAILLGDGECDDDASDQEEERAPAVVAIPAQVTKSVETLINLGLSPQLNPENAGEDSSRRDSLRRVRRNIIESLSRYSVDALGIDEDGVRAATGNGTPNPDSRALRYQSLRKLIDDGLGAAVATESCAEEFTTSLADAPSSKGTESKKPDCFVALLSKLLKFEEDVLGSTFWQKRGTLTKKLIQIRTPALSAQSAQREALPTTSRVQKTYNDNRSTASSLAVLLCFEGKPWSLLTDLAGDIGNESADPMMLIFTVQGWLNAAKRMLSELVVTNARPEAFEQMLLGIRDWRFTAESHDNMLLALASLALYIPETIGQFSDHSETAEAICDEVWEAYTEHQFESSDIGKLCLGLIGVCAVRTRSMKRLEEIVETLEKSVSGYGGQTSFGAYYALSVIAQALPILSVQEKSKGGGNQEDSKGFIGRIVGFLVNEMVTCIMGNHPALVSLVACIKNGVISPEIVDSLTALRKKALHLVESKRPAAKSLFIGFALCLPALTAINDELLLGVYCLLESLQWGTGKGIALPSVLQSCRQCGLFDSREIEKIYAKYALLFEESMDQGLEGLDDIFYAVTATMKKTIPFSIRRFLVGNRSLFDEDGRALSLLAAVVSLTSLPCLGCGAELFTDSAQLSPAALMEDVEGVVELISKGAASRDWNKYSQVAVLLMGFMSSMNVTADSDTSKRARSNEKPTYSAPGSSSNDQALSPLPTALSGTILEVVTSELAQRFYSTTGDEDVSRLLGCLEALSLPGHFTGFLEQMFRANSNDGNDEVKSACARLLVSQIRGRPRAVFDGREYVELALRISKTPVVTLRSMLGQGKAPILFIESMADIVPKFPSESLEEAVENIWRLCINQVTHFPAWTTSFLSVMKTLLKKGNDKQSLSMSPNNLNFLRHYVVRRIFAGIRDAPPSATSSITSSDHERSIIDMYVLCLMEIPITNLVEADFFSVKELDGFVGEALRNRYVMAMVRLGYFTTPSRASSEISSSIAWFCRQLVSDEDEVFSSTLLQVSCAIAEATYVENADRKREVLVSLLDNLLLTGSMASTVGLQMLGALVGRWCRGVGSDGDLSLACLCVPGMDRWQALSPPTLQQMFRLLVHDLPFNLATYCRQEKLSGAVFNRLWRIYNKWLELGADQNTINCVRKALICCRSLDSGEDNVVSLATSLLL